MATGKRKNPETKKLKKSKSDWVKNVLREWADAAGKNDIDVLGIDEAPEWVLNAWVECIKIVFPRGLPPAEKWDAEFLGEFLGRLYALEKLYGGEVPLGPETQAEMEKIEATVTSNPPLKNIKAIEKDFSTKFQATKGAISMATSAVSSASYKDAISFQKGLARGMEIKPDELATSRTFQRHTRTFLTLAVHWRAFSKCRSVGEIHKILCKGIGENKIGTLKTFENRVVKKIGLKVRGRGRPKAAR